MPHHGTSQNKESPLVAAVHILVQQLVRCKNMELVLDSQGELVTPGLYKVKTSESLMGKVL